MREYVRAVGMLEGVLRRGRHLDELAREAGQPFAAEIAYGVVRRYFALGEQVDGLLDRPLAEKHLDLRLLLMAGLHASTELRRPVHASVNAAVAAAAGLGKPWAKGLVNAVLRRALRQGEAPAKPSRPQGKAGASGALEEGETSASQSRRQGKAPASGSRRQGEVPTNPSLAARFNHPRWLIEALQAAWPQEWEAVLAANNARAPMTLRVNLARTSRTDMQQALSEAGVPCKESGFVESALLLEEPRAASEIPGLAEGLLSVQDEAAQLAAGLLNVAPGQRVLDACAAPGGKTCQILETCPQVQLTAIDPDPKRLPLVQQNLSRLGLSARCLCVSLEELTESEGGFARILVDAPCSATGIIRRHPDIRLLRQPADIDKLAATQERLLARAFKLLNPDGELVYASCSTLPRENDRVVEALLAAEPRARLLPTRLPAPQALQTATGCQLLPTADSHDGFFYARLRKLP